MKPSMFRTTLFSVLAAVALVNAAPTGAPGTAADEAASPNPVLEWNQIFIDTLIATNTANSSSQRLGAIVHTAIFDAYNGIERRYTPIFAHPGAAAGASRGAAVIAAAYTALGGLFPSRQAALDDSYGVSLAALSERCTRYERSIARRWCEEHIEPASSGALKSRRLFSPGARRMASARATQRLPAGPPLASGGPRRRRLDR